MTDRIEVTFPVTIRLDLEIAREPSTLQALRNDLAKLIEYAALPEEGLVDAAYRRPVALYTPPDDGRGSFSVRVAEPSTELLDFNYVIDHGEAATEARVLADLAARPADPYIRVQDALTEEQRAAIIACCPQMEGAHVADILAEASNQDALLALVEPFFERYADGDIAQPALVASAIRALYWASSKRQVPSDDDVFELVGRA